MRMIGSLVNVPVGSMSNLAMLSHEWANCNEGLCSYGNIIFSIKIRNIHIFLVSFSLRLKMFVPRISFNSLLWTIYFRKLKIFTKKIKLRGGQCFYKLHLPIFDKHLNILFPSLSEANDDRQVWRRWHLAPALDNHGDSNDQMIQIYSSMRT